MTLKLGVFVTCVAFMVTVSSLDGHDLRTIEHIFKKKLMAEPIVVEHPQNVTVFVGDPFSMSCVFSDTVNGTWNYKGGEGSGVGRLLQADGQISNPNTKFSFVINATSEDHNGAWSCSNLDRPEIKSSEAYVTIISRQIRGPPASVKVFERQDVELNCRLTFRANCTWLQDDVKVDIGHRPRVKYLLKNGINTYHCSIHIIEAREMDEGNWTCVASYNDDVGPLKSSPASVEVNSITAPWQPSLWFYLGLTTVLIATIIELSVCAWCCCHKLRKQRPTFQGTSRRMGSCSCSCKDDSDSQGASEDAHHCVNRSGTETGYEYADTVVATGVLMQQPAVINKFGNVFGYANHEIALGRSNCGISPLRKDKTATWQLL